MALLQVAGAWECSQARLFYDGQFSQVTCILSLSLGSSSDSASQLLRSALDELIWASEQCWAAIAGPELMVDAVVDCCHTHNDTVGLLGRPYLDVGKHTFSL